MAFEVIMPRLAAEMEEGTVTSWLVAEGASVEKGQALFQVESEKASVEVEAPASGILRSVKVTAGMTVKCGTPLALIGSKEEIVAPAAAAVDSTPVPAAAAHEESSAAVGSRLPHRATPAARRLAAELKVDVAQVRGTGPGGRVVEADVRAFAEASGASPVEGSTSVPVQPANPVVAIPLVEMSPLAEPAGHAEPAGQAETVELSRLRRVTGERMLESVRQAPHFDLTVDVDMSEAARLRERWNHEGRHDAGKVSYTAILARAVAQALVRHPAVNATFQGGQLRLLREVNLGVAVALKDGLIVPVVRNADRKSLAELSDALEDLRKRATEMRFRADELSGGTFTISNLGMYGIDQFSAIINPPEAAILAVGQIAKRALVVEDQVVVRPVMTMTLSVDHRVLDGAMAAGFLRDVKRVLENPYLLI